MDGHPGRQNMIYIESDSKDPYFNLALEEYVFEKMDRGQEYFMLWQNDNTIVVGQRKPELHFHSRSEKGI